MAVRASWGDRLLRVKGVLDVAGESQPLVIHGVHRTFHPPTLLARWPDADRRSRLVFIPAISTAPPWRRAGPKWSEDAVALNARIANGGDPLASTPQCDLISISALAAAVL